MNASLCHFVSIPKTASTSMHAALKAFGHTMLEQDIQRQRYGTPVPVVGFNHWTPQRLVDDGRMTLEEWRRAWSFGVVRNPWDRAVSLYLHHKSRTCVGTFTDWVDLLIRDPVAAAPMHRLTGRSHAAPQTEWTHFLDGTRALSFVGRYERLSKAWETVCYTVGLNETPLLPWENRHRAPCDNYRHWYTPRLRDIVAEFYRSDIEEFGYEF